MIDGVKDRRRDEKHRINILLVKRSSDVFEDRLRTTNYEIIGGIYL